MIFEGSIPAKRSLGALRKTEKTKPRSPDFTGKLKLQRLTMDVLAKQFKETDTDEIECCLAGWINSDTTVNSYPSNFRRVMSHVVASQHNPISRTLSEEL